MLAFKSKAMGEEARSAIRKAVEGAAKKLGVEVTAVYLFGSRARGEADPRSDWDILIVVRGTLPRDKHRMLFVEISRRLAEIGIPADILIRTEKEVAEARHHVFSIEKIALREGVTL